jgi:ribokinase
MLAIIERNYIQMNKIVVLGSLNMDLVINTPRIPVLGETIHGSGFATFPGGKGANQAVAAAKLGGDVTMIGCVGNDSHGTDLINSLTYNGVKVENIRILKGSTTGIAVIVVSNGDNFIILDSGANFLLKPEQMDQFTDVISNSDILMLQLEIPLDVVEKAVEIAKYNGVKVLLNPAPAYKLSDKLLSKIDIITPNENECEYITGIPIRSLDDTAKAIKYLMNKSIKQIIVTLGNKGVIYNNGDEVIHRSVPNVEVIDTTAAGDSFSGALAVALSNGKPIDDAINFANIVGTITVTRNGAQASLPSLNEVKEYIKNHDKLFDNLNMSKTI